jgi:hypothetical protein
MSVRGDDWVFPMTREEAHYSPGLTIREYAAIHLAAAMPNPLDYPPDNYARSIVQYADALIAELERTRT